MTPSTTVRNPLYGRDGELSILEALLTRLTAGQGSALVVSAPPGAGRTALIRDTAAAHHDGPLLHATGAPGERRPPYGGLHALLCSAHTPLPVEPDTILRSGITPGALLDLLTGVAGRAPLLICVDDAHAWDPHSRTTLAAAARALPTGSRVAVLLGTTEHADGAGDFAGLPTLRPGPLDTSAAAALLDQVTGRRLAPAVREALCREGAGNPRLLNALVEQLGDARLAGELPLPTRLYGGEDLLAAYAAPLAALPDATRALLLLAAAAEEHERDGAGADAVLLLRAARLAGLAGARLAPAEAAGAVRTEDGRVRFRHPLLRRAVLRAAPAEHRRSVHELIADILEAHRPSSNVPVRRPDRTPNSPRPSPRPRSGPGRTPTGRPRSPRPQNSPPMNPCATPASPPRRNTPGSRANPAAPASCWPGCARGPKPAAPRTYTACSPSAKDPRPPPERPFARPPTCWPPPIRPSRPPPSSARRTRPAPPPTCPRTSTRWGRSPYRPPTAPSPTTGPA